VSFSRTELDDAIFPRRGWYIYIDVHGGAHAALSDTNFLETLVKLRGVLPLAPNLRLYGRVDEGATIAGDFEHLPPSQRFFAGGAESVRGYAYQSLAPVDSYGNIAGGKFLTAGSLEADLDISRHYGLALFGDAGGSDDVPEVTFHYGAGIGFRYRAPFGAVAIDLAHPFDPGTQAVRLYLGVRMGL
jgi:translocation and assembly module TamA